MQKKDYEPKDVQHYDGHQAELSSVWQELLGLRHGGNSRSVVDPDQQAIPILEGDPWRKLLEAENIELVDLQQVHLPVSEGDIEQMFQFMQEQATQNPSDGKNAKQ